MRLFYFYLLLTAQGKRLVLQKLKDGRLNFKELHPKWRDDEQIVDLAMRLDLGNMACVANVSAKTWNLSSRHIVTGISNSSHYDPGCVFCFPSVLTQ